MVKGFKDSNGKFHPIGSDHVSSREKNIESFGMLIEKFDKGKNKQVSSEISQVEDEAFDETERWWNGLSDEQREKIAERFGIRAQDFDAEEPMFEIPRNFQRLGDFEKSEIIFGLTGVGDLDDSEFQKKVIMAQIDGGIDAGEPSFHQSLLLKEFKGEDDVTLSDDSGGIIINVNKGRTLDIIREMGGATSREIADGVTKNTEDERFRKNIGVSLHLDELESEGMIVFIKGEWIPTDKMTKEELQEMKSSNPLNLEMENNG